MAERMIHMIYLDILEHRYEVLPTGIGKQVSIHATLDDALAAVGPEDIVHALSTESLGEHGITGLRRVLCVRRLWDLRPPATSDAHPATAPGIPLLRVEGAPLTLVAARESRAPGVVTERWLDAALREGVRFLRLPCKDGEMRWFVEGMPREIGH